MGNCSKHHYDDRTIGSIEGSIFIKHCKYLVILLLVFTVVLLAACGKTEPKVENGISTKSILLFHDDAGSAELAAYFKDGKVPEEANILYDQMGSNPDITITDAETIQELYRLLSMVEVTGKSNTSITDCYHHVQFKLADNHYIYYSFEGSEIWCYGEENYKIQNSGKLFRYMQELTDAYCQQNS